VDVRDAAGRLGSGDLGSRAQVGTGPPEVRDLAASFNDMAARLEELVLAQESFVADASHQLRTPLTALRLRLENLEQEIDDPEASEDLAAARDESRRLSRLVDGLLTLARADRRSASVEREVVDLDAVVTERLDAWRPIAEDFGITLIGATSGVTALANPDRVAQVLDNLLANATDASPAGSELRVATARSADQQWVEVHVIDQGAGLTPDQRHRAFDRFWRADGGRGSALPGGDPRNPPEDDRLGGTGLGLAIVRQLVMADGGQVDLDEAGGGGIDAVVRLPAPAP
jgi:signal transduction histidine kinase